MSAKNPIDRGVADIDLMVALQIRHDANEPPVIGAAQALYQHTIGQLRDRKFADTGKPVGTAPYQLELIYHMLVELETATIWMRRQVELESVETPIWSKD